MTRINNKVKPITFDWNKGNIDKNWNKHKIYFRECEEIFFNKPLLINFDQKHSGKEQRFQALGQINRKKGLFISFTIRNKNIRIISSRNQNKKERRIYEQKN